MYLLTFLTFIDLSALLHEVLGAALFLMLSSLVIYLVYRVVWKTPDDILVVATTYLQCDTSNEEEQMWSRVVKEHFEEQIITNSFFRHKLFARILEQVARQSTPDNPFVVLPYKRAVQRGNTGAIWSMIKTSVKRLLRDEIAKSHRDMVEPTLNRYRSQIQYIALFVKKFFVDEQGDLKKGLDVTTLLLIPAIDVLAPPPSINKGKKFSRYFGFERGSGKYKWFKTLVMQQMPEYKEGQYILTQDGDVLAFTILIQ